ncbi:hypothetical protein GGI21_005217 [Coemansia aciculifera]|uniref:Uncharacterized protein n=1 Tax=Coemansia aciculifera TaxID=417176 RepID=A0ACC1LW96_9FUNG|nr:hypothetical protein IWW38_005243 [Coemansia aciculifera]KAJ2894967.1 hypothetical protein GGI21_005217 [Coemansia aciculifera]
MQRSKQSQKVLAKPFKSPSRIQPKKTCAKDAGTSTPTPIACKRPLPSTVPPPRKLDFDTPSSSITTSIAKRPLRMPQTSIASSRKRHQPRRLSGALPPRFVCRDEATLALVQEKNALQRKVADAKEEVALLERAVTLGEKKEAEVVGALISKWQVACSAASDDLFELLKPMMEAQRLADQMGFGGNPFADDKPQQIKDKAKDEEQPDEDIDIPYMLKRFGIDPELF